MAARKTPGPTTGVPSAEESILNARFDPVSGLIGFSIGAGLFRAIGRGIAWALPENAREAADADAYRLLVMGTAQNIIDKQREGKRLSQGERDFLEERVLHREAKRLANVVQTATVMEEIKENVAAQLPPHTPEEAARGTSEAFKQQAETGAEEPLETEVRDIFARLLAGEDARPGRFAPRTLDIARKMDHEVAAAFEDARRCLLADWHVPSFLEEELKASGLSYDKRSLLLDAGLSSTYSNVTIGRATPGVTLLPVGSWFVQISSLAPWTMKLGVERLTREGRQIHSVLAPATSIDGGRLARAVAEHIGKSLIKKNPTTTLAIAAGLGAPIIPVELAS